MKPDTTRRGLLKMLPALAVAAPAGGAAAVPVTDDRRLAALLLEVFSMRDSARAVGARYLAERPHEASFSRLLDRLRVDLDLAGWLRAGAGASDLRRRLQARAAVEYRNDDFLEIAGSYLTSTELRLCALSTWA